MKNIRAKIIAVDLDGTLTNDMCFTPEEIEKSSPIIENVEMVKNLFKENVIIIYTARRDHLLYSTVLWLKKHHIPYHGVSNFKMFADIYIDDSALRPNELTDNC